jgi:PAS domain S-box-containing protein
MNRFFNISIKAQLLLIVFIVALPAAGIIIHSGVQMRKEAIHAAQIETQRLTDDIVTAQENLIAAAQQLMIALAQLPEVKKQDTAKVTPILQDILTLNAQYSNIFMVDRTGRVWATAIPALSSSRVSDRRYFKNAVASGRLSSGEFVFSKFTGKPAIAIAYPQKDARGTFSGLIGIGFHLDHYKKLLEHSPLLPGTSYSLLDHEGVLLVATADRADRLGQKSDEKLFKRIQEGPDEDSFVGTDIDGRERIISYQKLRLPGEKMPYMYVQAGILLDVVLSKANKELLANLSLLTSFLIMAFIIAWLIGKRSIADRISLLEDASRLLASGDLRVRVADLVPGGELGSLGRTFDHMASQLALREQALVESERNYREIFNSTKDTIFVHDAESGKVIEINTACEAMYGYSRDEMLRLSGQELNAGVPPYTLQDALLWIQKALHEGPQNFEWLAKKKSGECFWVEVGLSATTIGGEGRVMAVVRDITERKQAEKKFIHLNRIYSLLSNVNQAIVRTRDRQTLFDTICRIVIQDGKFRMAWIGLVDENARTVRVVASDGFTSDYLARLNIRLTDSPEGRGPTAMAIRQESHFICNDIERDEWMRPWREQALKNGYRSSAAFPLRVFGRTIGAFNIYASEVGFFNDEETKLLDELALDISFALEYLAGEQERRRAEEALRDSEERFRSIFDGAMDGIVVTDTAGRKFVTGNRTMCAMLGCTEDELRAMSPDDIHPADAMPRVIKHLEETARGEISVAQDMPVKRKDGSVFYADISASLLKLGGRTHFMGVFRDITDRNRAEEEREKLQSQLLQAQKMEAVGQLAGGIAHDFNNILAAIVGYGNLIQMKMSDDDPSRIYLEQILASSERAANLTQSLLAFSRKQLINPTNINVNTVIRKVEKFLSRIIGEDVELKTSLSDDALTIFADEMQIEQILMNLATNARDAMPKGGQLHIETKRVVFDEDYVRTEGEGAPGVYAELSVTDTGSGMDDKVQERLFEPFFTTKELGRGTGLGLSIVYGIVKQNNGYITVSSEVNRGTTFKIYLPIVRSSALVYKTDSIPEQPQGGTETILLAEDNQIVRSLTRDVLIEFGYKVIEAADGAEALAKFMENKHRVNLLIIDVIMPRKNGREVYEEVKKWNPDINVLFTSGYPSDLIQKEGVLEKGLNFISKPSSPQELLKKVREVLEPERP